MLQEHEAHFCSKFKKRTRGSFLLKI